MSKRTIIFVIGFVVSTGLVSLLLVYSTISEETNQNQNVIVTTNDVNVETTDTSETETINMTSTEVTYTNSDIEPISENLETTTASGGTPNNTVEIAVNTTIKDENDENKEDGSSIDTPIEVFTDRSTIVDTPDKDHDSLTDTEETTYKTTLYLPDTDKDGYVDGAEVKNGFSPTEPNKTLLENSLTINYGNEEFGWQIEYPAAWLAESNRFTSDLITSEFVEVSVKKNSAQQSATEWIAHLYKNVDPQNWSTVEISGLNGIVSPDGLNYYLTNDNVLININYNFGDSEQISFRTTFAMMVNSFELTKLP